MTKASQIPVRAFRGAKSQAPGAGPALVALAGDDYAAAGDDLHALLVQLQGEPDDVAIWEGNGRLVAVIVKGQTQIFKEATPTGNGAAPGAPAPPAPAGPRGGRPQLPLGCKPAALARLFGSWGWNPGRAKAALARLGVTMAPAALEQELSLGRAGRGRLPRLGPAEVKSLRRALARAGGG
jgi:hypothetical protein